MQLLDTTQFKGTWSFKERGSEFQKGSQPKNLLIERQTRTGTMSTITSDYTDARFSKSDSALTLIDHQLAITQLNRDYSPAEYRNNLGASC
jgi:hypothetical protein